MAPLIGRPSAPERMAEHAADAMSSNHLHVVERFGDLTEPFRKSRKLRCAWIAFAPRKSHLSRKRRARQPRIANGIPLGYRRGRHERAALACGDHVFQGFKTGGEAIGPARSRAA